MVGRFFRAFHLSLLPWKLLGLNPHVVGRFFRDNIDWAKYEDEHVLIPMWWGGFSETI